MKQFCCTVKVVTFCPTDFAIGTDAKCLVFEKLDRFEANFTVLLSHVSFILWSDFVN